MQQQQIDGVGEHDSVNGGIRVVFTDRAVQNAAQLRRPVALSTGPYITHHTQRAKQLADESVAWVSLSLSDHSLIFLFVVTSAGLTQVLGSCSYVVEAFVCFTLFQLLDKRGGPVFV